MIDNKYRDNICTPKIYIYKRAKEPLNKFIAKDLKAPQNLSEVKIESRYNI